MHPYRILLAAAAALCAVAVTVSLMSGNDTSAATNTATTGTITPAKRGLPGGATSILPEHRVVAYYGAPGDDKLGILGIGSPQLAAVRLLRQTKNYATGGTPVMPAMELIAVVSTAAPGEGGLHRARQSNEVIDRYLKAARAANALLILDIQPGRANFLDEAKTFEKYLREPDVSLALDPEWKVGPGQVPGKVIGSITAGEINAVSKWLSDLVTTNKLPEKLLLIHQFTDGMITNRKAVVTRPGLDMVLNADGFGTAEMKVATYQRVAKGRGHFFLGFKLFFEEDTGLMSPDTVLALKPRPQVIVYE